MINNLSFDGSFRNGEVGPMRERKELIRIVCAYLDLNKSAVRTQPEKSCVEGELCGEKELYFRWAELEVVMNCPHKNISGHLGDYSKRKYGIETPERGQG